MAAWNACDTAADDSSACRSATLWRAGGIDEFGGAQVAITNTQKLSLQITSLRAVVDKRTPATFAARFDSESGGLIGEALALDLDQANSAAVHVEMGENAGEVIRSHREPFLGVQAFEIEAGRTWKFGTIPVSTFAGIVEWHLELKLFAQDPSGKVVEMTEIIRPDGGTNFRGVSSEVRARQTLYKS
ncbi:hypothetical protein AB0L70_35660 [Kribbella sp. NPDC051952]|uniref:hypothetical protein n=1 Tax=Kribbella sp. NPDC051952 TaxID=3154851 RepID=UPI00341B272D